MTNNDFTVLTETYGVKPVDGMGREDLEQELSRYDETALANIYGEEQNEHGVSMDG